jgi:hypothetical protein
VAVAQIRRLEEGLFEIEAEAQLARKQLSSMGFEGVEDKVANLTRLVTGECCSRPGYVQLSIFESPCRPRCVYT